MSGRRKRRPLRTPCSMCEHCEYICEGDFLCLETYQLVGSDFAIIDDKVGCRHFQRIEKAVSDDE